MYYKFNIVYMYLSMYIYHPEKKCDKKTAHRIHFPNIQLYTYIFVLNIYIAGWITGSKRQFCEMTTHQYIASISRNIVKRMNVSYFKEVHIQKISVE